jgi:RimJ/RimL family protein N-acetyltransferase
MRRLAKARALRWKDPMFDYQPHLTGELLDMRPVTAADWEALFAIASDPGVWELHPRSDRYQEAVFRPFFEDGLASGAALVAISRADGAVAGWSRYSAEFAEPGEIEIGWTFLGRAFWGGAYNGDMKRLMLTHAFRFVGQVIFRVGEHNLRSRRAVEKIGGRLTDRTQVMGEGERAVTNVIYAIAREDFRP